MVGNVSTISWGFTTGDPASVAPIEVNSYEVKIHPNPTSDVLNIQTKEIVTRVEVVNAQGQVIKQINGNVNWISVSDLAAGTYILKVTTANGVATQRFVKQ